MFTSSSVKSTTLRVYLSIYLSISLHCIRMAYGILLRVNCMDIVLQSYVLWVTLKSYAASGYDNQHRTQSVDRTSCRKLAQRRDTTQWTWLENVAASITKSVMILFTSYSVQLISCYSISRFTQLSGPIVYATATNVNVRVQTTNIWTKAFL